MKRNTGRKFITPRFPSFHGASISPRILASSRINGGMITSIDPADLELGQSQYIRNSRIRFDKVERRAGYRLFSLATKPDSAGVLKVVTVKDVASNSTTLRFTKSSVHKLAGSSWTAITGTLTGGDFDRFSVVVLGDNFFFSNNGADEIQKITSLSTFADLGNAPRFKYITGFYERLVGASRLGSGESGVNIGWSGQNNPDEWDSSVDISANEADLIESPSDLGDHIKGVFGITNYLVIPRERSIWLATKNPSPQNPFNFYNAAPGVGSNLPYTIKVWEQGIIFADARTGTVWFYAVGESKPEPIGRPNDKLFVKQLAQVGEDEAFASYDPVQNEYTLVLPNNVGGVYQAWTYNFRTQAWSYDEYPNTVLSLQDFDYASGFISIDDLVGNIDDLVGNIDDLSPSSTSVPTRMFGLSNGDIAEEARDDPAIDDDFGTDFNSDWVSKNFQLEETDVAVGFVRIGLQFHTPTTIDFFYTTDGDLFEDDLNPLVDPYYSYESQYADGRTELFNIPLNVRCRSFKFKLKADNGLYKLVEYEVHVYPQGKSLR